MSLLTCSMPQLEDNCDLVCCDLNDRDRVGLARRPVWLPLLVVPENSEGQQLSDCLVADLRGSGMNDARKGSRKWGERGRHRKLKLGLVHGPNDINIESPDQSLTFWVRLTHPRQIFTSVIIEPLACA